MDNILTREGRRVEEKNIHLTSRKCLHQLLEELECTDECNRLEEYGLRCCECPPNQGVHRLPETKKLNKPTLNPRRLQSGADQFQVRQSWVPIREEAGSPFLFAYGNHSNDNNHSNHGTYGTLRLVSHFISN